MLINKIKNRISEATTEACGYSPLTKVVSEEEINRILEQESGWIPCSERLPEEPEENSLFEWKCLEVYLVTTKYGSNAQDKVYPFRAFWNGINFTDGIHPEGYAVTRKKTNADRIRSMTDEELLDFLCSIETYEQGSVKTIEGGVAMCSVTEVEQWLKAESEG